jgi:predicted RNase H-like nuclease
VKAAGVDAALGGWIAVVVDQRGFLHAQLFSDFGDAAEGLGDAEVIGVDVPIGLPAEGAGARRADLEARRTVGARRSSVFAAPVRVAFDEASYAAARARFRGISAQAWALKRAILEVERYAGDPRVYEVHPEVSFWALNGGEVPFRKRSWNGMQHRLALLREAGIAVPPELEAGRAPVDDVLDAAAVAWTARRIANGTAQRLPADPAPGEPTISY